MPKKVNFSSNSANDTLVCFLDYLVKSKKMLDIEKKIKKVLDSVRLYRMKGEKKKRRAKKGRLKKTPFRKKRALSKKK